MSLKLVKDLDKVSQEFSQADVPDINIGKMSEIPTGQKGAGRNDKRRSI
jgi:hypothetical protein